MTTPIQDRAYSPRNPIQDRAYSPRNPLSYDVEVAESGKIKFRIGPQLFTLDGPVRAEDEPGDTEVDEWREFVADMLLLALTGLANSTNAFREQKQ